MNCLEKITFYWVLLTNSASKGLSDFDTLDFVVHTFKGLIIVRVEFDVSYFDSLIQKLNSFYKNLCYLEWFQA